MTSVPTPSAASVRTFDLRSAAARPCETVAFGGGAAFDAAGSAALAAVSLFFDPNGHHQAVFCSWADAAASPCRAGSSHAYDSKETRYQVPTPCWQSTERSLGAQSVFGRLFRTLDRSSRTLPPFSA